MKLWKAVGGGARLQVSGKGHLVWNEDNEMLRRVAALENARLDRWRNLLAPTGSLSVLESEPETDLTQALLLLAIPAANPG